MSDTSQGDGWWQASDGKWYAPEKTTPPPPPPPQQDAGEPPFPLPATAPAGPPSTPPPASSSGDDDGKKPPLWKRRWFLIAAAVVVVLIVISAFVSDPDEDADPAPDGDSAESDEGATDSTGGDDEAATTTSAAEPSTTVATTTTAPLEIGGTRDAPFTYGTAAAVEFDSFGDADGSIWNATIGAPVDITAAVLAENSFNDPPADGTLFAGFTVEMTLAEAGKEPLSPGFNFSWEILGGASSAVHEESAFDGCGVSPDEFDGYAEVFVGGTLTGVVCIPIPTEDLTDLATQVAIHHSADSRTIFAP